MLQAGETGINQPTNQYYAGICLQGLKKTTKISVRTTDLLAEI
jgi:hypothetical protein